MIKFKKSMAVIAACLLMSSSVNIYASDSSLINDEAYYTQCGDFAHYAATLAELTTGGEANYYVEWFYAYNFCIDNMQ